MSDAAPPGRVRVAMFVLNTCHADARVLKEAGSLGRAGYDVRVFALADPQRPAGLSRVGDVAVLRLPVVSLPQQVLGGLQGARRRRRPRATAGLSAAPPSPAPSRRLPPPARSLLLRVHRPSVVRRFWKQSGAAARAWRPDICHAHDLNTLPGAARVAARLGVPLVYDSHELWRRRNRHGELRPVGRVVEAVLERRAVQRCDAVITVSGSIARWLEGRYPLRRPATVLRNVPSAARARDAPSLRDLAGLPDGRILLYTGRISSGRGLLHAVDSLALLPADIHLVLLGYGPEDVVEQVERRAERVGVRGRVHLAGAVRNDQVTAVAAQADAALVAVEPVCLSYRFCLPNKLFEATSAGLPVVVSDLPDMRQVVEEHGLGATFVLGDEGSLARAVEQTLADGARYRAAAARAAGSLSWEHEEQVLLDLYAEVLQSRAHARMPA